jgi:steroid 5-alpha reductase family enzyme
VNQSFGDLLADLWPVLLATLAAAVILQLVTFFVGLRLGRLSVVDVTWGASFALITVVGWLASTGGAGSDWRRALIVLLTVIWGGRLAVHIGLRQRGAPEDPRYTELMAQASRAHRDPRWSALRSVFLLQAVAAWIISIPLQIGLVDHGVLGVLGWIGVLIWAVGFFFESVGDTQLERFKADPANRGQVMDRGLWRYTRHPNYFGDACVWWGLFLLSAEAGWAWLAVVSPLLMTWFLTAKTGKPLMEKQLAKSRPGYADYVARTSGFVPFPPKRSTGSPK